MIAIDYILSSNEVYDLKGQDWWVNDKMCACAARALLCNLLFFYKINSQFKCKSKHPEIPFPAVANVTTSLKLF